MLSETEVKENYEKQAMLATTRALQFDRRPPDAEAVSAPLTTLGSAPHTDQTRIRPAEAQPGGAPPPAAVAKPLRVRPAGPLHSLCPGPGSSHSPSPASSLRSSGRLPDPLTRPSLLRRAHMRIGLCESQVKSRTLCKARLQRN